MYRVLDLFCGLGGFSQAFASADATSTRVRWLIATGWD